MTKRLDDGSEKSIRFENEASEVSGVSGVSVKEMILGITNDELYAKNWFNFVNEIRRYHFQKTITWDDCFNNFDTHFNSLINHMHPYVYANIDDCLIGLSFKRNDDSQQETVETPSGENKIIVSRSLMIQHIHCAFANYDEEQVKLGSYSDVESLFDELSSFRYKHGRARFAYGFENSPVMFYDDLSSKDRIRDDKSADVMFRNRECFMWAFNKITDYFRLNVVALIRCSMGARASDMLISFCELGIIKHKDEYTKRILDIAADAADIDVVKWLLTHNYAPRKYINFEMIDRCIPYTYRVGPYNPVHTKILREITPDTERRLAIAKLLFEHIKTDASVSDLQERPHSNDFAISMYREDPEYAETMGFINIRISKSRLLHELPICGNIGNLLDVAVLDGILSDYDLHHFLDYDRVDLVMFAFDRAGITIQSLRANRTSLFILVCNRSAKKIATFLLRQGMTCTDISADPSHYCVKWFMTIMEAFANGTTNTTC
jgi:hypothetical protein